MWSLFTSLIGIFFIEMVQVGVCSLVLMDG